MQRPGLVLVVAAISAAGCAVTPSAADQELIARYEQTIPTCSNDQECLRKWEAAQLWIVKNAGFKLQNVTSVIIETYNATDYSPNLAMRATKEPAGGGNYRITFSAWCANMFGCSTPPRVAAVNFNAAVNATN